MDPSCKSIDAYWKKFVHNHMQTSIWMFCFFNVGPASIAVSVLSSTTISTECSTGRQFTPHPEDVCQAERAEKPDTAAAGAGGTTQSAGATGGGGG